MVGLVCLQGVCFDSAWQWRCAVADGLATDAADVTM